MIPVVNEALSRLQLSYEMTIITDAEVMKSRGLRFTPALEINGQLLLEGPYPGLEGMITLLKKHLL